MEEANEKSHRDFWAKVFTTTIKSFTNRHETGPLRDLEIHYELGELLDAHRAYTRLADVVLNSPHFDVDQFLTHGPSPQVFRDNQEKIQKYGLKLGSGFKDRGAREISVIPFPKQLPEDFELKNLGVPIYPLRAQKREADKAKKSKSGVAREHPQDDLPSGLAAHIQEDVSPLAVQAYNRLKNPHVEPMPSPPPQPPPPPPPPPPHLPRPPPPSRLGQNEPKPGSSKDLSAGELLAQVTAQKKKKSKKDKKKD